MLEPNLIEAELLAALHNLDSEELATVGHLSRQPAMRGVSLALGSWLFCLAEAEYEKRHGREQPWAEVLDFHSLNDSDLAGTLHAAGILLNSMATDKLDDFGHAVMRLVIAHSVARLQARQIVAMN